MVMLLLISVGPHNNHGFNSVVSHIRIARIGCLRDSVSKSVGGWD